MKLETFFEKFELFADVPDAVAKLRELVLELAVNGRLTAGYAAGRHVENWRTLPLRDVADYRAAAKVDPISIPERAWLLDLEEVEKDSGRILKFTTFQQKASTSTKAAFVAGDVLYGKLRPYLNKVVVAPRAGFCTTEIVPIRSRGSILPEYLCLFLRSPGFVRYATSKSYGMKMPRLGTSDAESAEISIPSLAEQRRIVAKVDELMVLCDRLEAQQQQRETQHAALSRAALARFAEAPTSANLEFLFHKSYAIPPADLRKSILTLAVPGRLVASGCDSVQDVALGEILSEPSFNGVSKGPVEDESAVEVLRISAGTSRGDFYVDESDFKHVSLSPSEVNKAILRKGDLLACRYNGNLRYVGRFSIYAAESGRVQVNPDKLIRFRVDREQCDPRYVCYAMNAAPTRERIEAMCATTAGNIGLSAGKMKTVDIPLPPLAEQRRIVAKVDELMTLVDKLEAQLASARATATNLLAAAVAELTHDTEPLST